MSEAVRLTTGTPQYRRVLRSLFVAAFCCFACIYVAQGIMPAVSRDLHVSPAAASLTLSLTTLPLAAAVVLAASLSEGLGRRRLLVGTLVGGTALTLAAAASPNLAVLLGLRVLTGLSLAGLPALAMAYVAEEVEHGALGAAMGLYVGGTALGGMSGRLLGGLVAGALSWRWALVVVGVAGLAGTLWVARTLPSSRHFVADPAPLRQRLAEVPQHLSDPLLRGLYACGFVLMGTMVALYNYLQFRLADPPFSLPAPLVAGVFLLYVFGTVSSSWMGRLTDRRSRRAVLLLGLAIMAAGLLLTLPAVLPLVLLGTALATFGFFGAHAVASGWVNAGGRTRRAQASALYLFCYHVGSSLAGFVGGVFFGAWGWPGVVGMIAALLCLGMLAAVRLPGTHGGVQHAAGEG